MLRRLGLPWIILVAAGVSGSGAWVAGSWTSAGFVPGTPLRWVGVTMAVSFLLTARRLLLELRDIARDSVTHPERPLPSGRARPEGISRWVVAIWFVCTLNLSIPVWGRSMGWPLLALFVCAVFLYLSMREFLWAEGLASRPTLRAFGHNLLAAPLAALSIACYEPELVFSVRGIGYALLFYGSGVVLSFSRALDPAPNEAWPTVVSSRGPLGAFVVILAASALSAWGAKMAGASNLLGAFEWALVVLCALAIARPDLRRFASVFGAISFFAHAWAGPLVIALRTLRH